MLILIASAFADPWLDPTAWNLPYGSKVYECGHSVAVVPDFTGDGTPDVAAGCTGANGGYLLYDMDGLGGASVNQEVASSNAEGMGTAVLGFSKAGSWFLAGAPSADSFAEDGGRVLYQVAGSLTNLYGDLGVGLGSAFAFGDVNGDGVGELFIGTASQDGAAADVGGFNIYSVGTKKLTFLKAFSPGEAGAALGTSLAVGDYDGDGLDDLAVGGQGWHFVYYGNTDPAGFGSKVDSYRSPEPPTGWGAALDFADVDGDGADELIVGAPTDTGGGNDSGSITIFAYTGEYSIWNGGSGDRCGSSVVGMGDNDFDGREEVAVGCPGGSGADGRVVVLEATVGIAPDVEQELGPTVSGGRFGASLAAGDLDLDGLADLVVGAPSYATGAVFVLWGRASGVDTGDSGVVSHTGDTGPGGTGVDPDSTVTDTMDSSVTSTDDTGEPPGRAPPEQRISGGGCTLSAAGLLLALLPWAHRRRRSEPA